MQPGRTFQNLTATFHHPPQPSYHVFNPGGTPESSREGFKTFMAEVQFGYGDFEKSLLVTFLMNSLRWSSIRLRMAGVGAGGKRGSICREQTSRMAGSLSTAPTSDLPCFRDATTHAWPGDAKHMEPILLTKPLQLLTMKCEHTVFV